MKSLKLKMILYSIALLILSTGLTFLFIPAPQPNQEVEGAVTKNISVELYTMNESGRYVSSEAGGRVKITWQNYGASYSQSKWVGFTDTGYRLTVPIVYENSTSTCAITVEPLPDSSEFAADDTKASHWGNGTFVARANFTGGTQVLAVYFARTSLSYWTNINVLNPEGVEDGNSAYFDLDIVDSNGQNTKTIRNLNNEPDPKMYLGYGSIITIYNIRSYLTGKYVLDNVTAENGNLTNEGNGRYKYTVKSDNDNINVKMKLATHTATINTNGGQLDFIDGEIVSGTMGSQFSLPNPTREGYNFAGWKLEGSGDLKSGKCAAAGNYNETHKVDIDGTAYTNFKISGSKTTEDNYPCALRFDTFNFIHNHEYELSYQLRINALSLGFQVRFSRLDNDWEFGVKGFNETTEDWINCSMVQTLKATDTFNGGEIITNPRIEFNSDSTKWASVNNWVIDIDIKNIVVKDITNNSIAWSSQVYTFGSSNGTLTAEWTEKTWDEYAAESFAGGVGSPTDPYQISSPAEFALLAKQSKENPIVGNYYKLTSNIDLSDHAWGGIGNINNPFNANFDGNLRCISNIRMKQGGNAGLFNVAYGARITQIILQNGEIITTNDGIAGGIVGYAGTGYNTNNSTITKCIVENVNIKSLDNTVGRVGGITGVNGAISNCTFKNGRLEADCVGGICYYNSALDMGACSVINATIVGKTSINMIAYMTSYIKYCYGFGTLNGVENKLMYGAVITSWSRYWVYPNDINGGYPVQRSFYWLGITEGSKDPYEYLKTTLGFTIV